MLDTNCKSLAVLTKCAAKGMIARNRVEFLTSMITLAPTLTYVSMPGSCTTDKADLSASCHCYLRHRLSMRQVLTLVGHW